MVRRGIQDRPILRQTEGAGDRRSRQRRSGSSFFLGFLFQVTPPVFTSGKCRDNVLESEKKSNGTLKILAASDLAHPNALPVSVVTYTTKGRNPTTAFMVRASWPLAIFAATLKFTVIRPSMPKMRL
jgi:hypothetical protein